MSTRGRNVRERRSPYPSNELQRIKNLISLYAKNSSPLTMKGDIFVYDTGIQRLAVGTNGQVLTVDSSEATGLKWVDGGGSVTVTQYTGNFSAGSEIITIPAVDRSTTYVLLTTRNNVGIHDGLDRVYVTATLTSTTTVKLERDDATSNIWYTLQVIENS